MQVEQVQHYLITNDAYVLHRCMVRKNQKSVNLIAANKIWGACCLEMKDY